VKRLVALALVLLTMLPLSGRAQGFDDTYFYVGTIKEVSAFVLEFARSFVHPPVLLRNSIKAETSLFVTASLSPIKDDEATIRLRDQPYQEDLDKTERQPTVGFLQLQTSEGVQYVQVLFDDEGGNGWDDRPTTATGAFEDALIKALDAKFKRRSL
jgi:hypothetical protein